MTYKIISAIFAVSACALIIILNLLYIKMTKELFFETKSRSEHYHENIKNINSILNSVVKQGIASIYALICSA